MKTEIRIRRENVSDGVRWWIDNWDDYLKYLEANSLPKPSCPYAIFINHDIRLDFPIFEKEIPTTFYLDESKVTIKYI